MTVPKYSNVCDALCHTKLNKKMGICPAEKDGKPTPIIPANYKYDNNFNGSTNQTNQLPFHFTRFEQVKVVVNVHNELQNLIVLLVFGLHHEFELCFSNKVHDDDR